MGQRNGFSPLDIEKINRMYNCYDNTVYDETPADSTLSTTSFPYRAGQAIGDFFNNVLSGFNKVG